MTHADHCSIDGSARRASTVVVSRHGNITDSQLLADAKAGDQRAFTELCDRYAPVTKRKIFSIVQNAQDAEDALQETLLRAYMHLEGFRETCRFSTWIVRIGINQALMLLRKRKHQPLRIAEIHGSDAEATELPDPPDLSPEPEQQCAKREKVLLLRRAVRRQRPEFRVIIDTYYQRELSLQETADALGISLATAKSRLGRGRQKLRRAIESYGIGRA